MNPKYLISLILLGIGISLYAAYHSSAKRKTHQKQPMQVERKKEPEVLTLLRNLAIKYKSAKQYYGDITYEVYDEKKPSTVVESFAGICAYDVQNFYIKSLDCENVLNDKYKILVSEEEKTIYVGKRDSGDDGSSYFFNPRTLDSIRLIAVGEIILDKTSASLYSITYKPSLSEWEKITMSFNPVTMEVKQVLMWVGESYQDPDFGQIEKPVVRCTYSNQRFNVPLDAGLFNSEKYFTVVNGKINGTGKLSGYEVELLKSDSDEK